jgi:diguanylate cyclase (GGDEF)-like protein
MRRLGPADLMRVTEAAFRLLRGVAEPAQRTELQDIEDALARAVLADEVNAVIHRLEKVRPDNALTDGAILSHEGEGSSALRRVLDAGRRVAQSLDEAAVVETLTRSVMQLSNGASPSYVADASAAALSSLAEAAGKLTQKRSALERVTQGLMASLARLAASESDTASSAQTIVDRLQDVSDAQELYTLQAMLLQHAEELVRVATERDEQARAAMDEVQRSLEKIHVLETRLHAVTEEALTDPLTKLTNRRGLEQTLEQLKKVERVGVLAIDIDHFKSFNDTYGHAAGDVVLRHIADLMRAELRAGDFGFRVGGEEMLILLPQTDWTGARATAVRLHRRIEQSQVNVGAATVKVTVSIGISLWSPAEGERYEVAAERADAALYRAKALGRSRVVG